MASHGPFGSNRFPDGLRTLSTDHLRIHVEELVTNKKAGTETFPIKGVEHSQRPSGNFELPGTRLEDGEAKDVFHERGHNTNKLHTF